ncbi:BgMsFReDn29 [Biomphalaria glabrata]
MSVLTCTFVLLTYFVVCDSLGRETNFVRMTVCYKSNNLTVIYKSCFDKTDCRSLLECSVLCVSQVSCLGVLQTDPKTFYYHKSCSLLDFNDTCGGLLLQVHLKHYLFCGYAKMYNLSRIGWTGDRCDVAPQNCTTLKTLGFTTGFYWVNLLLDPYQPPKLVVCEITSWGQPRFILFKSNGRSDHNKTFAEFVSGYKIDESNYFIGLDTMYYITKYTPQRIDIEVFFTVIVEYASWFFMNVRFGNTTYGYSFTWNSKGTGNNPRYQVHATPCNISYGAYFSAWDLDRDGNTSVNVASKAGAGWYFDKVLECNPLGRLPSVMSAEEENGQMLLPGLDMVNGSYAGYLDYVKMFIDIF